MWSSGVVTPDPSKLTAINDFPVPTTKSAVRSFLGLAGYYRRFIPTSRLLLLPSHHSLRKPLRQTWSGHMTAKQPLTVFDIASVLLQFCEIQTSLAHSSFRPMLQKLLLASFWLNWTSMTTSIQSLTSVASFFHEKSAIPPWKRNVWPLNLLFRRSRCTYWVDLSLFRQIIELYSGSVCTKIPIPG